MATCTSPTRTSARPSSTPASLRTGWPAGSDDGGAPAGAPLVPRLSPRIRTRLMTRNAALSEAVDALTAARGSRCLLDALPRSARPADKAEAYAIQNEVARRIGPVTAWKVGASGPDAE